MRFNRFTVALLAVVVVAVVGAGSALALSGGSTPSKATTPATPPAPVKGFAADVADALSATRGPATTVDGSTVDIDARLQGANSEEARFARTAPGGGSVYILPSGSGFCLTSTSGLEAGCYGSTEVSASSIICAPSLPENTVEVFGVAPDGTDAVTIERADGSKVETKVEGNVYIYLESVKEPRPLKVTWNDAGKTRELPAHVPPDFADTRCAKPSDIGKMQRADPSRPTVATLSGR